MSDTPTKARGKRKAGYRGSILSLKPSASSKQAKIDNQKMDVSTGKLDSATRSNQVNADSQSEHLVLPSSSSLILELVPDEDVDEKRDYDKYDDFTYESDSDEDDEKDPDSDDDFYSCNNRASSCDGSYTENGVKKMEIDEIRHGLGGAEDLGVKLSVYITKGGETGNWLDNIHVESLYNDTQIGYTLGYYVHRQGIKANFLESMEMPDMVQIAVEVFDKVGRLNRKFKEHIVQRGTGVWGDEMDDGPLCLIEQTKITDTKFRRMGLGRAMVKALIEKAQEHAAPYRRLHMIVKPGSLLGDLNHEYNDKSKRERRAIQRRKIDSAIAFYRSLGFRRIGSSSCFCFSLDPRHKAHSISINADYDPPREDAELEMSDDEGDIIVPAPYDSVKVRAKRLAKLEQRFPLEHAITTLPDTELVDFFQTFEGEDGSEWEQVDCRHNNILHQAACALKVQSTKWLLDHIDPEIRLARNLAGFTPLEALQDQLDKQRVSCKIHGMIKDISDRFVGFPSEAVACLSLLTYGSMPSFLQALQLKYGCTCGQCIEGFMSPHIASAFLRYAEQTYHKLDADPDEVDVLSLPLSTTLRKGIKDNKRGFADLFGHIADLLKSRKAPTVQNLLQMQGSHCLNRNFIEAALQIVLKLVIKFDELIGRVPFSPPENLRECRNDHEFGMVRLACGLQPAN
ncbi:hypothetical protein NHQ30_001622 [Ciborinia camelliae]|nr:hypothetical protein NHQ30_001622 [Ciborinia camelliae]